MSPSTASGPTATRWHITPPGRFYRNLKTIQPPAPMGRWLRSRRDRQQRWKPLRSGLRGSRPGFSREGMPWSLSGRCRFHADGDGFLVERVHFIAHLDGIEIDVLGNRQGQGALRPLYRHAA
jgi:hypothetical protein